MPGAQDNAIGSTVRRAVLIDGDTIICGHPLPGQISGHSLGHSN